MTLQQLQRAWDDLGSVDPFWAMTGTNKYGAWDIEAFFRNGENQVGAFMEAAAEIGLPKGRGAVLDYGCGVGRLARGFRREFSSYVGVDIAESLIIKARELYAGLPGYTFMVNVEDHLRWIADGSFDLVYCWGVLQHVSDREVVKHYLSEFYRVLKPGGLLYTNAMCYIKPIYRLQPRRRIYSALRGLGVSEQTLYNRLRLYPQSAHTIPEQEVLSHLKSIGAKVVRVTADSPGSAPHQFRSYYVTR